MGVVAGVVAAVALVSGDGEAGAVAAVEDEDEGIPRISASAAELDAAIRLAAMIRARWARGLL